MSHDYVISHVPPEHLPYVWGDLERVLAPAVSTAAGKVGMDDLYLGIADGSYVAWVVLKDDAIVAAFTTRVAAYPKRKSLVIDWVGGKDMFRWINDAMHVIKVQAQTNDCRHVEGYGRTAWGRALKRHGFAPEYVAYRMELGNG
jgi:hypothetical protein